MSAFDDPAVVSRRPGLPPPCSLGLATPQPGGMAQKSGQARPLLASAPDSCAMQFLVRYGYCTPRLTNHRLSARVNSRWRGVGVATLPR